LRSVRFVAGALASLASVAASLALALFLRGVIDGRALWDVLDGALLAAGGALLYAGIEDLTSGGAASG
jgi:hypothetical protein